MSTDRTSTASQADNTAAGFGLELQIDELVLHGFPPGDRFVIAAAIERELTRLFSDGGAARLARGDDAGTSVQRLAGESFEVPHGSGAEAIGVAAARAIHSQLLGVGAAGGGRRR